MNKEFQTKYLLVDFSVGNSRKSQLSCPNWCDLLRPGAGGTHWSLSTIPGVTSYVNYNSLLTHVTQSTFLAYTRHSTSIVRLLARRQHSALTQFIVLSHVVLHAVR